MRLKELRINKSLTQAELSKLLQISPSTIGMYEQGRRVPDVSTLKRIADFFNVSIDYLLGNDTPPVPVPSKKDQRDLDKFLNQTEIMFDGDTYRLNDTDREKIRTALKLVFWDAKESNRRKKD